MTKKKNPEHVSEAAKTKKGALAVFSFSLFLSAACMFSVQPMAGKMLLPLVGGTPAGWVVAMAFFQVMLLAGYCFAYLLAKLNMRVHGVVYILLLGAGAFFLPLNLAAYADYITDTPDAQDIFRLLTITLAVPFIALSTGSSTIQRLFTATGHEDAKDPYFLYAASNLGSFGGLLSYPLLIEPFTTLSGQAQGWMIAYALLAISVAVCLFMAGKERTETAEERDASAAVTWRTRFYWLALAFLPSSLLMGVTTYLTTDIISVPMIWVVPLAIYLLGFVVAFSRRQIISAKTLETVTYAALLVAVQALAMSTQDVLSIRAAIIQVLCFSVFVLYCDMRLAAARPPERRLSEFYLFLALGGALGGVFNAFVAPHIFVRTLEYPLSLLALALFLPMSTPRTRAGQLVIVLLAYGALIANAMPIVVPYTVIQVLTVALLLAGVFCILKFNARAGYLFPIVGGMFLVMTYLTPYHSTVYMTRNFFGSMKVFDGKFSNYPVRFFMHGTTLHGMQMLDEDKKTMRTTYYTDRGQLYQIFETFKPRDVIVIGLGAGNANCFNAPDRKFTFIDIDPDVVHIAKTYFPFLDGCKSAAPPRILVGDGRLEMAKMGEDEKFDLLVIDAFSSDSIPAHLLTQEAIQVYLDHLTAGGIIAVHISNRHFKLHTPIAETTRPMGLQSIFKVTDMKQLEDYATKSVWVVLADKSVDLTNFAKEGTWVDIPEDPDMKPWTDNYTNLLSALSL